jgi:hypothetical protein
VKLTNMKIQPAEAYPTSPAPEGPRYPYGLEITLEEEAIAKLELELPKHGAVLGLTAKVTVTSVAEIESGDPGQKKRTNRTIRLQITDLALGPAPGKRLEEKLYEGSK